MLVAAAVVFAVAALAGVILAALHLRKRPVNIPTGLVHGAIAAAALVLLVIAVVLQGGGVLPVVALAIFVAAAVGGFVMLALKARGYSLPPVLILGHGGLAVAAFVVLLAGIVAGR